MENSAAAEMLLKVQERITGQVPLIRHVEEELGQLEDYDVKPAVSFPCSLLSIEILKADDMGDNTQMVQAELVIRLALPPYSSGANWYPLDIRKKSLKVYDLEYQLYVNLHGWAPPEGFSVLSFRSAKTELRQDPIRVRELRYEFTYEEYSAQYSRTKIPVPAPDVSGEFEAPVTGEIE